MKVLTIGSTGLLGSAVQRKFGGLNPSRNDLNLCSKYSIYEYISKHKPDVVVNCGAISQVDKSETDRDLCINTNAMGVLDLALACRESKSMFIHISTDYVYGNNDKPALETDLAEPLNNYGKIKLFSEVLALGNKNTYVLRVSSLYGKDRSCHSEWVLDAARNKKKARICSDMIGTASYTGDLADWISDLVRVNPAYGIYNLVPDGHVSRYDFAVEFLKSIGENTECLEEIKISDMNLPSIRPSTPIMDNHKWCANVGPLPHWKDGIKSYIRDHCSLGVTNP